MTNRSLWKLLETALLIALPFVMATAGLLLAGATPAQSQNQTLQGTVQQNQNAPFVNVIEAGSNVNAVATRDGKIYCDWMQGACNMLHAYVSQGGSRSDCLDPLKTGVEFEREERSLSGPQSYELDKEKADLEGQRDKALAQVPKDCFSGGGRPNTPQDSTIPDYPILREVRPKADPTPPYVRPDGSFGPTTGGLVTDTNSCVQGCVGRLHQRENDCAARTTRAYGVNAKTMADYEACIQPAMIAFNSEYRQCFPQNQNQPSQPIAPSNTAAKPFACQAYWNDRMVRTVGACGRDQSCINNAKATVQRGLAACWQGQPQKQPQSNPASDSVHGDTGVAPPLAALQKTLDAMAPHYDMTKPGEGLRVIRDILVGMGLGYVARGLPAGLRALAAKAGSTGDNLAGNIVENSAGRGSGAFGNNGAPGILPVEPSWNNLPPGVQLPKILQTTPRPIYQQTRPYSCVQACVKMAVDTVRRRPLPESYLRELSRADPATGVFSAGGAGYPVGPQVYTPGIGTPPKLIGNLLTKAGVPNTGLLVNQTVDDLATGTASGYPAVVGIGGINPKNAEEWLHAIVVDAVEGAPGSRTIFYRDPMNINLLEQNTKTLMQNSGYTGRAWMSEQDFAAAMQHTGGQAVYTRP